MGTNDSNGASKGSRGSSAKKAAKKTTKKTTKKSAARGASKKSSRRASTKEAETKSVSSKSSKGKKTSSASKERTGRRSPKPTSAKGAAKATTDRVAIVAGLRTPFVKANTGLKRMRTLDLAVACVKELIQRTEIDPSEIDLCVYGQVVPTVDWLNIAREVVIGAGLPRDIEAYSVSRACATSIQALTSAAEAIQSGRYDVAVVGGADSTTDVPLKVSARLRDALIAAQRAKSMSKRLKALSTISLRDLLPGQPGFSFEPSTGEQMGEAAEKMAKLNGISRTWQDEIALASHTNAAKAWANGVYDSEVMGLVPPPYDKPVEKDNIVRDDTTIDALAKLRPVFDRKHGTITAGNASPLTDGASALLVMRESKAKALGYKPLGYLKSWSYAAVDPSWQLLMAPALAAPKALDAAAMNLGDMDLVDIHEAFAAQVASNLQAMASASFNEKHLGRSSALGEVDPQRLNVNGGSIAIGHPFAATGGRMVLTSLNELGRRGGGHALLTLCAAGGLGAALVLEGRS